MILGVLYGDGPHWVHRLPPEERTALLGAVTAYPQAFGPAVQQALHVLTNTEKPEAELDEVEWAQRQLMEFARRRVQDG